MSSKRECRHVKFKDQCRKCGGSKRCIHNKIRYYCIECGGEGLCTHLRRKNECRICHGPNVKILNRQRKLENKKITRFEREHALKIKKYYNEDFKTLMNKVNTPNQSPLSPNENPLSSNEGPLSPNESVSTNQSMTPEPILLPTNQYILDNPYKYLLSDDDNNIDELYQNPIESMLNPVLNDY